MTFAEYLKLGIRNSIYILFITLFCVIAGFSASNFIDTEKFDNSLFFTVSIKDKGDFSDAYSNLQASDQFTESLQGWFKDQSLLQNIYESSKLGFPIKAKKQDKNNLIISYSSDTQENGKIFKEAINSEISKKISAYNSNSDIRVFITSSDLFVNKQESKSMFYLIVSTIIGIIFGYVFSFLFETNSYKLTSYKAFIKSLKPENSFVFSNYKKLKLEHHFLTTYLNNKYKNSKLQLLDLTHKSKIGLEILSKHGSFEAIKSFDIPSEISEVKSNVPVIVIAELGKTSTKTLKQIKNCGFTHIEGILLDKV